MRRNLTWSIDPFLRTKILRRFFDQGSYKPDEWAYSPSSYIANVKKQGQSEDFRRRSTTPTQTNQRQAHWINLSYQGVKSQIIFFRLAISQIPNKSLYKGFRIFKWNFKDIYIAIVQIYRISSFITIFHVLDTNYIFLLIPFILSYHSFIIPFHHLHLCIPTNF